MSRVKGASAPAALWGALRPAQWTKNLFVVAPLSFRQGGDGGRPGARPVLLGAHARAGRRSRRTPCTGATCRRTRARTRTSADSSRRFRAPISAALTPTVRRGHARNVSSRIRISNASCAAQAVASRGSVSRNRPMYAYVRAFCDMSRRYTAYDEIAAQRERERREGQGERRAGLRRRLAEKKGGRRRRGSSSTERGGAHPRGPREPRHPSLWTSLALRVNHPVAFGRVAPPRRGLTVRWPESPSSCFRAPASWWTAISSASPPSPSPALAFSREERSGGFGRRGSGDRRPPVSSDRPGSSPLRAACRPVSSSPGSFFSPCPAPRSFPDPERTGTRRGWRDGEASWLSSRPSSRPPVFSSTLSTNRRSFFKRGK